MSLRNHNESGEILATPPHDYSTWSSRKPHSGVSRVEPQHSYTYSASRLHVCCRNSAPKMPFLPVAERKIEKLDKITLHYEETFLLLQWIFSFCVGSEMESSRLRRIRRRGLSTNYERYSNSYPIFIRHDDSVIFSRSEIRKLLRMLLRHSYLRAFYSALTIFPPFRREYEIVCCLIIVFIMKSSLSDALVCRECMRVGKFIVLHRRSL